MRPALFVYTPDIWNRLIQLLDDMDRYACIKFLGLCQLQSTKSLYSAIDKDLRVETTCIIFFIITTCVALEQFCCT